MDSDYGARYRELFQRHWWWRARERVILDALRARQPAAGWRSVLDVGCGDGLFFDELAKLPGAPFVEGVEPGADLVSSGGPHRARIHVAPFDASFDVGRRYSLIVMLDVLEHLPDPAASLRHALSLLEPDGVFLATVPAFNALWTRHDDLNHHYLRYDKRSFARLAAEAALRIDESRYFFHWTAAAKLVTRIKEALIPGEPTSPGVPPAPVNRGLYALSRLEEWIVGALPMPFGSSLLVVGGASNGRR
jgi:2-polyprenyl-3-methyl-5-hydroxy-6-metoxy-1,4-benzoquinol methylase